MKKPTLKKGTVVYRWNGASRDEGVVAKKSKGRVYIDWSDTEIPEIYELKDIKYQVSYDKDKEIWRWNAPQANTSQTLRIEADDTWEKTYNQKGDLIGMRLLETLWFLRNPYDLLTEYEYNVTEENAKTLEYFVEGKWVDTYYWFYSACGERKPLADEVIKWMVGPLKGLMGDNFEVDDIKFRGRDLGNLVEAIVDKKVTATMGKDILSRMIEGEKIDELLEDEKYKVSSDDEILKFVKEVIEANPSQVEEYKSGKEKVLGWFVGQVMKASKGKANAGEVNKLLREELKS